MKHTLSVIVQDESGVLSRIAGLFARRGFNIESLAVGPTEELGISRITMIISGDSRTIEQLIKQLYKLINILKVQDVTDIPCVERELMLVKVKIRDSNRNDVIDIANIFRAKIVDCSYDSLILEITGDPGKIVAIEQLLCNFNIVEIARTGKISILRESKVNTELLKYKLKRNEIIV